MSSNVPDTASPAPDVPNTDTTGSSFRPGSGIPWPRRTVQPIAIVITDDRCAQCDSTEGLHYCPCGDALCGLTACSTVHWDHCPEYRAWLRSDAGRTQVDCLTVLAVIGLTIVGITWAARELPALMLRFHDNYAGPWLLTVIGLAVTVGIGIYRLAGKEADL